MAEEVFNAGNADMENIKTVEAGAYGDAAENTDSADMVGGASEEAKKAEKNGPRKPADKTPEELIPDEDGIIPFVDMDMLISDIIDAFPDASLVFMRCGMFCITCPASQMETLEQACMVHGMDPEDVVKVLNDYLTEQKRVEEESVSDAKAEE